MKKYVLITLVALILLSCDDENGSQGNLVGSWIVVSLEQFNCSLTSNNKIETCPNYNFCGSWEFKTDGSYTVDLDNGGVSIYTYTRSGNEMELCAGASCTSFTLQLSDNTLILTEDLASAGDCVSRYVFEKI